MLVYLAPLTYGMLLNQQVLKETGILIGQKRHGLVIHKIIGADEFSVLHLEGIR